MANDKRDVPKGRGGARGEGGGGRKTRENRQNMNYKKLGMEGGEVGGGGGRRDTELY